MITKHAIKLDRGISVVMILKEETFEMDCYWDPGPPFSKAQLEEIKRQYIPWRDEIVRAWSERNGKKAMVITI
jgi:hypothetical protein